MKKRTVAIFAALALAGAAPAVSQTKPVDYPVAVAAKSCSAGYVHASLPWGHKCLRRGQFCKISGDRYYHKYGFHCHTGRLR
jgi:hypothetical protein